MFTGALDGIKIVDLTRVLAGPFCTMLLADMGAEVIKVEEAGKGDDTRGYPPFLPDGDSAYFGNMNRNKRSMTLDLKNPEGKRVFLELVKKADVVVENYKPGTMEKLGLGYEALKEYNEKIIFASISGFGQYGRYRERPGYDIIGQAMGGLMSVSGWPDSPPTRSGTAMGDILGGLNCCIGILAAITSRNNTGKGQAIDVALVDSVVSAMETLLQIYLVEKRVPGRTGNRYEFISPYDTFEAKDGWVVIAVGNDAVWKRFCETIGRADLYAIDEYLHNPERVKNHDELKKQVTEWTKDKNVDDIVALLLKNSIPSSPIYTVDRIVNDEHIAIDREMFVDMETANGSAMKAVACPIKFSDTKAQIRQGPPSLGQHNEEILQQVLNMDKGEIEKVKASGALGKNKER